MTVFSQPINNISTSPQSQYPWHHEFQNKCSPLVTHHVVIVNVHQSPTPRLQDIDYPALFPGFHSNLHTV